MEVPEIDGVDLLKRNRNYRNLWYAKVGSQFGDWFNQVALAQITLLLTDSAVAMGLVLLCGSLPGVVLGPLLGPYVDRFSKKPLLFYSDLLRAVFSLGYSGAIIFEAHWILYVCSLFLGIAGVLFAPARSAVIPLVVDRNDLTKANALESGMGGMLQIIGAGCGGFVALIVSPITCFVINAFSYLWSAVCIQRCHWLEVPKKNSQPISYIRSLKAGFQEAFHNQVARAIMLIGISWGLAGGGYYILLPILGQDIYAMGALGIGLLYAVDGLGVLIGSVLVHRLVGSDHRRAMIWYGGAYVTQALFFGLLTQSAVFFFGMFMLLLMRISSGVIIPLDSYLLQVAVDPEKRGRIFSLHGATYGGFMQLSFILTGTAFEHIGIAYTGLLIGGVSLLCGLFWLSRVARKPSSDMSV
ncbi:MFS transporter [Brevibacillus humidisoli]|uniref:MFS transporter n=1 Tax=Brevibacillus humidisoli TaxID=2895522 RepID=UPI001E5F696D|nr:MFS transporter [Brevibacillus humidisoli]UFJ43252.1 MFS transporter [Brevibacillus humidisoli]